MENKYLLETELYTCEHISESDTKAAILSQKTISERNYKMCYLIAKKFNRRGCIAVEANRGKELASLVSYLGLKKIDSDVQILTVSDMDAFGEYKPYELLKSEGDFIQRVLEM